VTIEHLSPRTKFRHCLASRRAATSLGIKRKWNVANCAAFRVGWAEIEGS
jgi:hypothetical protein